MNIKELFLHLDFLSSESHLYSNGKTRRSNTIGGFLSLGIAFVFISLSIYFAADVIKRNNPKSFRFDRFEGNISRYNISNEIFFYLKANNQATKLIYNSSILNITAEMIETGKLQTLKVYQMDRCDYETDFKRVSRELFDENTYITKAPKLFCIKWELGENGTRIFKESENFTIPYLQYGVSSVTHSNIALKISVKRCVNSTMNNFSCLPDSAITNLLYPAYIELYGIDRYVEIGNYSYPIKMFVNNMINMKALNGVKYGAIIKMQQSYIVDHIGWILDYIQRTLTFNFISIEQTEAFVPENYEVISDTSIMFMNMEQIIDRSYETLQEYTAKIGGILKFFTFAGFLVNMAVELLYSHKLYVWSIFQSLPLLQEEKQNEMKSFSNLNYLVQPTSLAAIVHTHPQQIPNQKISKVAKPTKKWCCIKLKTGYSMQIIQQLHKKYLDERNVILQNFELVKIHQVLFGKEFQNILNLLKIRLDDIRNYDEKMTDQGLEALKVRLFNLKTEDFLIKNLRHLLGENNV